jgi:hypothetical protein
VPAVHDLLLHGIQSWVVKWPNRTAVRGGSDLLRHPRRLARTPDQESDVWQPRRPPVEPATEQPPDVHQLLHQRLRTTMDVLGPGPEDEAQPWTTCRWWRDAACDYGSKASTSIHVSSGAPGSRRIGHGQPLEAIIQLALGFRVVVILQVGRAARLEIAAITATLRLPPGLQSSALSAPQDA